MKCVTQSASKITRTRTRTRTRLAVSRATPLREKSEIPAKYAVQQDIC